MNKEYLKRVLKLLKSIEFSGTYLEYDDEELEYDYEDNPIVIDNSPWEESCCPCCNSTYDESRGHYDDCELSLLIEETEKLLHEPAKKN